MVSYQTSSSSKQESRENKKSDKKYINRLGYSSIEFPATVKQINKIENQNSIIINVFGYEKMQPYPIYISIEKNDEMNLLLITEQKITYHDGKATEEDKKEGI